MTPLTLEELAAKRLLIVVGKGGVGRTATAAALASITAARGRQTLLYQASSKEKLGGLLGGPAVGETLVKLRDHLWAVNTNPASALHEYGLMVLRYETIYKMVFENRFAKALVRAIPGVDDYSILGKLWWHTTETEGGKPRWDTVVFDAPATGHAVTMMRIPHAILEAVPEGPLTRDAAKVKALLTDPVRTAVVIVTLAEEMPTNESIELAHKFGELGMAPRVLVVNQLPPDRFHAGTAPGRVLGALLEGGGAKDDPALAPVVGRGRLAAARRELADRYLARLASELPLPTIKLPLLFSPTMGPPEIEALARAFQAETEALSDGGAAA